MFVRSTQKLKSVRKESVVTDILRCVNGWTMMMGVRDMNVTISMLHLLMLKKKRVQENLNAYHANIFGMTKDVWWSTYLKTNRLSFASTVTIGSGKNQGFWSKVGVY